METVNRFLENCSLCGLSHISTSKKKYEKVFWVVVSVLMIAGAGYLIDDAVDQWDKYPISTTTKTIPIHDVQFPKIVVCPPKVAFSFAS